MEMVDLIVPMTTRELEGDDEITSRSLAVSILLFYMNIQGPRYDIALLMTQLPRKANC